MMWETWKPRLFSHEGRIGRLQYLGYHAVLYLGVCALMLVEFLLYGLVSTVENIIPALSVLNAVQLVIMLLFIVVAYGYGAICITIKRLHDLDISGWAYVLLILLGFASGAVQQESPGLSAILALASLIAYGVLLLAPGTKGTNRFDQVEDTDHI